MGRKPCCDKFGLKRGPWTIEEDHKLMTFILNNGIHCCWRLVPKLAGLLRCGKSCRLRWTNYLRPGLKRGALSQIEEDQIIELHRRLGNRWSKIASHFPGRTDNEIKNQWNTRIKKRLRLLGLDPLTHVPIEHKENGDQGKSIDSDVITTDKHKNESAVGVDMETLANTQTQSSHQWMNNCSAGEMGSQESKHYYYYSPPSSLFSVEDCYYYSNSSSYEDSSDIQQWFSTPAAADHSMLFWDGLN